MSSRRPPRRKIILGPQSVLCIDVEPLLRAERARCRKASQDLDKARKKLEWVRNDLAAAYSKWFYSEFGALISRIQSFHDRLRELESVVSWVRTEVLYTGVTEKAAYTRYLRIRAGLEEEDTPDPLDDEDPRAEETDLPDDFEERVKMAFEDLVGPSPDMHPQELAEQLREFRKYFLEDYLESQARQQAKESAKTQRKSEATQAGAKEGPSEVKRIYRELARKLHPDHNPNTPESLARWHEVQAAYEQGDLTRLEILAGLTAGNADPSLDHLRSLSRLQEIAAEFAKKTAELVRAFKQSQRGVEWAFHLARENPRRLKHLHQATSESLIGDLQVLEDEVDYHEKLIARWTPKRPLRAKSSPKS